jgi:LysR family hydrogen peroxide-inducible transcriptional activator
MTLTELRYIVAVARERHFGKAAEDCFVSQPTLSVSIKKLESELKTQIFERRASEISLTDVGKKIVEQAQLVLDEASKVKLIADQGKDHLIGPLRLGVIFTVGPYLLPRIVKTIISATPEMPLILFENYTVILLEQLKKGSLDIAILAEPFDQTGLEVLPMYDESFVVAVPESHSLNKVDRVSAEDLKYETMLLLGVGHCFRDQVLDVCPESARFSSDFVGIQKTFEGSSLETIRHMVASGLGITVLPKMSLQSHLDNTNVNLIEFKNPVPSRRVSLVWRKSFSRTKAIDKIHDLIFSVSLPGCKKIKKRNKVV